LKSVGDVTNIVTLSAYATTAALRARCPIWMLGSLFSNMRSNGCRHSAYNSMLSGKPCLITHCIGMGPASFPFICIEAVAFSYKSFMRPINHGHIPQLFSIVNRQSCAILSNDSRKSIVSTHRGVSVTSACAPASRTMDTASMIELPGTLQNWLVRRCSSSTGCRRFTSSD